MCQVKNPAVDRIITDKNPSSVVPLPKRRLNPAALEFVSSRSESEASSVADEADYNEQGQVENHTEEVSPSKRGPKVRIMGPGGNYTEHHGENINDHSRFRSHPNYGWESPQGVLPPTPPYLGALPPTHFPPHPSTQNGHSDSPQNSSEQPGDEASPARGRTDGAASPPPGPAMSGHPGHPPVMAPYSWGHAAYPIYHIYPHDGVGPGIDRAGSPPAVFPAGGSPPLGPGFISVPVHGSMGGSSPPGHPGMMYGGSPPHSLGSSPPGGHHYLYMPPPAHYPHALGGPVEMQHRMSAMSINSPEGVSPRASSGTSSAGGRKESTRASARIARSHRAGGAYNPSDFEFKVEEGEDAGRTTVMIRNIPNKYNQSIMLALLEEAGLKGTFDFFYLPIDFRNRCGLGYAFVNFLTHGDAVRAYKHFHQRRWDEFNSKKVCEITYGRVQGRDSLVQHFKSAKFPSSDAEYCPLVFSCSGGENGEPLEAHSPLPIHEYLEVTEGKEEETE